MNPGQFKIECRHTHPYGRATVRIIDHDGAAIADPLMPHDSLRYVNHSPDGFAWGYGGSGPGQLAFAILLALAGEKAARANYMRFKWEGTAQGSWDQDLDIIMDAERFLAGHTDAVAWAVVER